MTSVNKRKQLVNELRKAHFPFGFESNKDSASQYKKQYLQHELHSNQQSKDRKANNFSIGSSQGLVGGDIFGEHALSQMEKLQIKKSNDENNIVLGYDKNQSTSNYKDDFVTKGTYQERSKPIDQRKPNISLGDSLTNFTTTYQNQFDPKNPPKYIKHALDSRKSNLILGNDGNNFATSNSMAFTQMPLISNEAPKRSYETNINLGNNAIKYDSENKQNFAHKNASYQGVDKQTIQDFRSAHFHFGFNQTSGPEKPFQSEVQAHYHEKPIDFNKAVGNKATNIQLNVDQNNYYESSYGNDFKKLPAEKARILNKNGRAANVYIGSDANAYLSEAKSQFAPNDRQEKSKPVKPQSNLVIGDQKTDYLTHYNDTFIDKTNQSANKRVTKDEIHQMKNVNYVTGFQGNDYQLSSNEYGNKPGLPNVLPKEVLRGMRNTNIVDGDKNFHGKTTYKAEFHFKEGQE